MKADTSWPEPTGLRLENARTAFTVYVEACWKYPEVRPGFFNEKPGWVKELWAQVAEAASGGAYKAFLKRRELEGRTESWDDIGPYGQAAWRSVVTALEGHPCASS
jgi:hypothetical protein